MERMGHFVRNKELKHLSIGEKNRRRKVQSGTKIYIPLRRPKTLTAY